jgi:glutaredoxin
MYTQDHCPFCQHAKAWLEKADITFEEKNISHSQELRAWLKEQGHRTVPQLYVKDTLLVEGGYQGLAKLDENTVKQKIKEINAN